MPADSWSNSTGTSSLPTPGSCGRRGVGPSLVTVGLGTSPNAGRTSFDGASGGAFSTGATCPVPVPLAAALPLPAAVPLPAALPVAPLPAPPTTTLLPAAPPVGGFAPLPAAPPEPPAPSPAFHDAGTSLVSNVIEPC